jgi:hypothetical protein
MQLLKTGLSQSLHLTTPISEVEVRGRAPNSFINSFDESHAVGGVGKVAASGVGERVVKSVHENGFGESLLRFSFDGMPKSYSRDY